MLHIHITFYKLNTINLPSKIWKNNEVINPFLGIDKFEETIAERKAIPLTDNNVCFTTVMENSIKLNQDIVPRRLY